MLDMQIRKVLDKNLIKIYDLASTCFLDSIEQRFEYTKLVSENTITGTIIIML